MLPGTRRGFISGANRPGLWVVIVSRLWWSGVGGEHAFHITQVILWVQRPVNFVEISLCDEELSVLFEIDFAVGVYQSEDLFEPSVDVGHPGLSVDDLNEVHDLGVDFCQLWGVDVELCLACIVVWLSVLGLAQYAL